MFNKVYTDLIDKNVGTVLRDEPLYKHTTFKVGGPAHIYVLVKDTLSMITTIRYCRQENIQFFVLGNGSNLIFDDRGFEGVVIKLSEELVQFHIDGDCIKAGAGASMIKLAYEAANIGLTGFEFMSGIPGTVGGGVYMNAGAYQSAFNNVVSAVKYLDDELDVQTYTGDQLEFGYRKSIFQKNPNWIILEVEFKLETSSPQEIKELIDLRKEKRMASQPWNMPSAGSVFRNPDDQGAWYYIDAVGLRGFEIGGAMVSPKHSNFIVNTGYASAKDILDLIQHIKTEVYNKFGIELKQEVFYVSGQEHHG